MIFSSRQTNSGRKPWAVALERALNGIASLCMAIAATLMTVLILIFGWLVFGRYVLNNTPTWVEQASLIIVAWVTFLGAAIGVARGSHLSIDFIREAMPDRIRDILRIVTDIVLLIFGCVMAWQGVVMMIATHRRLVPMISISEAWRSLPVAICGVLIILFTGSALLFKAAGQSGEE